ncbi:MULTISPECIES: hypothetical protein [Enterobacteriaceae]|uniref:hypothetical protein n=1 Tax=Enterobacteriaceae TaxID=543 RepID=UPI002E294FBC|nr:hypothetical protein [Klebsiella pneumoniae]MED6004942.1 hypothetical protein [Klebsiella pneumoniae]MED6058244.1 hypothetical protein [Klebsiella pneumoniae]
MLLEQFMVVLGAQAETEKVKGFGAALAKVATIGATVVAALKTVTLSAWAFFDGTVRRAEELYNSNNALVQVTKEQVEMSKKYQDGMGRLGKIIESVKIKVAFGFLPTMLNMVETFNKMLDANKDLIANGITKLLNVVTLASQVVNNTVRFITKAIEATIGWKGALMVLAAAFIWVRRAMLLAFITNPIAWVIAAIVGLMLLIDDFMTYLDGGESQFGEFWGAMLEWIDRVKPQLLLVWDLFKTGMGYLKDFGVFVATYFGGALIDAVQVIIDFLMLMYGVFTGNTDLMSEAWSSMVDNLLSMFNNLASLFVPLANMLTTIMTNVWQAIVTAVQQRIDAILNAIRNFVTSVKDIASNIYDAITAPFAKAFNWISDKFSSIGGLISGAVSGVGRLATVGPTSAVTNSTVNGGNMTVNAPITVTGKDAQKTATLVQNGLSGTLNTAMRNMSSKVIA